MSDIQTTAAPDGWKPTGGAGTVPKLVVPTHIDGLSGEENALLRELAEVWTRHASRNRTLTAYYEAKEPLVDFGLTVPKSIKDHYTPLGWARKAVDMLAELCVFEGFVSPGVDDPFELQDFMSRIAHSRLFVPQRRPGLRRKTAHPHAYRGKLGRRLGLPRPAGQGVHGHHRRRRQQ